MLLISSRFENMWIPLGVGVAGFLSGMALANSNLAVLMAHPFVLMLKPAVAMSAQPDMTAVSYTHLDVYKRQPYRQDNDTPALNALKALRGAPISMGRGEIPVELCQDVYKRQGK